MLEIKSTDTTNYYGIEILMIEIANCTITSAYKPLNVSFTFHNSDNFNHSWTKIITCDFNSHHLVWGYSNTNNDRDQVEQ